MKNPVDFFLKNSKIACDGRNKVNRKKLMADRIFKYDRQEGTEMGWHGKTIIVPDLNLDNNWLRKWDLVPRKIKDADDGEALPWVYLRCSDNPSIRIGKPYNPETFVPVDNAAFLQMIKDSISGTDHKVVSVGSLRNRARVFVSIMLMGMEKFKAAGREFGAYLNFGNGHDKSSVVWCNTSNICTVCDNTFTCNLVSVENKEQKTFGLNEQEDTDDIRIAQRHTKNVKIKLPEISKLVDKAIGVQAEFQLEMDQLATVQVTATDARNVFAGFLGRNIEEPLRKNGLSGRASNTVNTLETLFTRGKGNRGRDLSDVFSAATDFYTHSSSGGKDVMRQVLSSEYGAGMQNKRDFWSMITDEDTRMETAARGEELLANTKA